MSNPTKQNVAQAYPPSKTAVLLLDYHNCLVNMISPAEKKKELLESVAKIIEAARQNSVTIVHGLIDFSKQPFPKSKITDIWETNFTPMLQSNPEAADEWADIRSSGSSSGKEITVRKTPGCISNLKSDGLLKTLKEDLKVESLLICGLSTSGAVLSTARDAADLGFVTTVIEDGCWDHHIDSHENIMEKILPMTVWVVDLSTALDLIQGKGQSV